MSRRLTFSTSCVLVLSMVCTANAQPNGYILFEYWLGIRGRMVSDVTGATRYPDNPDKAEWRDSYKLPFSPWDNYGSRARGFLYPPADDDYTFWISADDVAELYLSTDDDPANANLIAEVPQWTPYLGWSVYPEQQSAPITLVGGQKYYIESIVKEEHGGDHMEVAWAGFGAEPEIIDGAYLSPVVRGDDDPLPVIYAEDQFVRGDCNGDDVVDISDAICILSWLFLGDAAPRCVAATDTNGDAEVDLSDAVYLLSHLFLGGHAPVEPFPECGPGTTTDEELGCEAPPPGCQPEICNNEVDDDADDLVDCEDPECSALPVCPEICSNEVDDDADDLVDCEDPECSRVLVCREPGKITDIIVVNTSLGEIALPGYDFLRNVNGEGGLGSSGYINSTTRRNSETGHKLFIYYKKEETAQPGIDEIHIAGGGSRRDWLDNMLFRGVQHDAIYNDILKPQCITDLVNLNSGTCRTSDGRDSDWLCMGEHAECIQENPYELYLHFTRGEGAPISCVVLGDGNSINTELTPQERVANLYWGPQEDINDDGVIDINDAMVVLDNTTWCNYFSNPQERTLANVNEQTWNYWLDCSWTGCCTAYINQPCPSQHVGFAVIPGQ